MRDKKRVVEIYSYYDHSGLARRLERMAARGWMLEKAGSVFWTYARCEPVRAHFSVTYCAHASVYDPEPGEGELSFRDFCEHTGWRFVSSIGAMQIYVNFSDNPVPIDTDPELEVENIHRTARRAVTLPYAVIFILGLLLLLMQLGLYRMDPLSWLADTSNMSGSICWVVLMLMSAADVINYYLWYFRAKKAAAHGEFLPSHGTYFLQITALVMVLAAAALMVVGLAFNRQSFMLTTFAVLLVLFVLMQALVQAFSALMRRAGVSAGANRAVTFIAAFVLTMAVTSGGMAFTLGLERRGVFDGEDGAPLTLAELEGTGQESEANTYLRSSPVLAEYSYSEYYFQQWGEGVHGKILSLSYEITSVRLPSLYDRCVTLRLEELNDLDWPEGLRSWYEAVDPGPWGADAAYRCRSEISEGWRNSWLLCYPDSLVVFEYDGEMTPERYETVRAAFA